MKCTVYINEPQYIKLKDINWDFPVHTQDTLSQLHPYPARFIESLPRMLINSLDIPLGCAVLDPFCGSGTTLLEAQRSGYSSIGVDLNPIACLISRTKVSSLHEDFVKVYQEIIAKAESIFQSNIEIPSIPNLNHWFKKDIQTALASLIFCINEIEELQLKDSLMFCLSSIIVRVSNQDSDTRYAAVENNANANDVFLEFERSCKRLYIAKDKTDFNIESTVINKNILDVTKQDFPKPVGLVVTSPPYPNAYEYWLYHKYRMWWLGYDPISVRNEEIGARPHYQKKNGQTEDDFASQMDSVFQLFDTCVVENGNICIVIGRSIIKGRFINNAEIIIDIARNHGYALAADIEREISSSRKSFNLSYGKINTENILIFKKESV